ncbi:DUF6562 domain-containing protein [Parabacteroides bouchesdurhonensis]|uniref:DUF6562 domain-containing protein n=1 Tax=Parabacteroides bouchesdurhonensis TaxID=1936995 RepID=UPI00131BBFBF|nr:DUF6562 domain-containing protein [Parabacteroides bouchesdurhonensis]
MKKYHLYLWIIALVGLMTSCSQDETDALQTANESNRVTLTAALPADFVQPQPQSRALPTAPSDYKLRCILEIWDTEATPALKVRKEICPAASATQIDFSFELSTTGTYKALLWADYINENYTLSSTEIAGLSDVEHYKDEFYITKNGLKAVEAGVSIPSLPDAWDAFYASAEFTKASTALAIPKVTLTRPLMKLTFAEKNAERFASCSKVNVTFDRPSKFDVATGTVTATKSSGISAGNGWLNNGTDITIGGQTCKTLICLYLFAGATDGTMGDIKLAFTATDNTKTLPTVTIPAGIPVKRNHRINAAGNLIGEPGSDAVTMTVDINSDWAKPDEEIDMNPLKVGNYYYADGTWSTVLDANKTCIGIVFTVNADGKSGKIVSLDETNLKWSTVNKETGISNTSDGAANMTAVQAWIASDANTDNNTLADFPAFNWCINKNDGSRTWYLPAVEELKILAQNADNVNTALTTLNKTTLDTNEEKGYYWSSHEGNSSKQNYAKSLIFKANNGASVEVVAEKKTEYKVRAISVF